MGTSMAPSGVEGGNACRDRTVSDVAQTWSRTSTRSVPLPSGRRGAVKGGRTGDSAGVGTTPTSPGCPRTPLCLFSLYSLFLVQGRSAGGSLCKGELPERKSKSEVSSTLRRFIQSTPFHPVY